MSTRQELKISADQARRFLHSGYRFVPMSIDPELRLRIARGEYDVDPQAVAEAIAARLVGPSGVLVPAQLDRLVALAHEDEAPPPPDAA
jgi:hypothetical protein